MDKSTINVLKRANEELHNVRITLTDNLVKNVDLPFCVLERSVVILHVHMEQDFPPHFAKETYSICVFCKANNIFERNFEIEFLFDNYDDAIEFVVELMAEGKLNGVKDGSL